jgi:Zn-dependent peptidase ImmA (M78 family)
MATRADREVERLLKEARVLEPPVDVEALAARCGAQVSYEAVSPHISGLLYRDEQRSIIGINARNSRQRQRFTIAHELGHLLLHEGELIFDTTGRLNWRDESSSLATDPEEIEANASAAQLLMPESLVRGFVREPGGRQPMDRLIRDMAKTFDVSVQAMQYRLINLGLLMPS